MHERSETTITCSQINHKYINAALQKKCVTRRQGIAWPKNQSRPITAQLSPPECGSSLRRVSASQQNTI